MAKLTLDPVGNLNTAGLTSINDNFDKIEAAIEATLTRAGTTPNQMTADLDMNHNDILNVDTFAISEFDVTTITADHLKLTGVTSGNLLKYDGTEVVDAGLPSQFATAAQGALADSALQPGDEGTLPSDGTDGQILLKDTSDPLGAVWSSAASGLGDMLASAYDPAGKGDQVLTVSDLLDEDTMSSNSATKVPSQQSVKAYVDQRAMTFSSTTALQAATVPSSITQVLVNGIPFEEVTSSYWNLGPELVSNGALSSDTVWTKGAGWTIGSGVATKAAGASNSLGQNGIVAASKYYFTSFDVTAVTAGNFRMSPGGVSGVGRSTVATFTEVLGPTVSTNFGILATASTTAGSIDNVSCKLMPAEAVKSADGRWWAYASSYEDLVIPGKTSFEGPVVETFNSLADAATITPDLSVGNLFEVTLGGNRTLANPSNISKGQAFEIYVTQDGTGSRTLSFGTQYYFPGGVAPVLSTGAGSVDGLYFRCVDTDKIYGNVVTDFLTT